jgi:hypothetical protein
MAPYLCYAMFRKERESENIKERRNIYAARNFSDKYDFALFKYQTKFMKLLIIFLIVVSKLLLVKNDIFQIAKKPIRDGRLALPDLKNEFC